MEQCYFELEREILKTVVTTLWATDKTDSLLTRSANQCCHLAAVIHLLFAFIADRENESYN